MPKRELTQWETDQKPRKRGKTNVERVTEFMEYGSPLNQCFVVAAIDAYAKQIKASEAAIKAEKHSFVNGAALVACAYDWEQSKPA